MIKKFFLWLALPSLVLLMSFGKAKAESTQIDFYWSIGCPHCAEENAYLSELAKQYPELKINSYEISQNRKNLQRLVEEGDRLNADTSGVPFTVIGDDYLTGFARGITDLEILALIQDKMTNVGEGDGGVCSIDETDCGNETADKTISLPMIGPIETKDFSLPALTVVIGALDGFNPCAMWTLLFLISLLLGMNDRRRMWILGTAFIVASAFVYFLFMSAWLNLLLFIGFLAWIRIIIGLVALGGGGYSIKEFFTNKTGGCKIAGSEKRRKVFDKLKEVTQEKSFLLALTGIILLAFAVNLVELVCSAGLPAIYTQILTMSNLPAWQNYLYISLYILFFMIDDLFVFFTAMATLQLTGITTKYTRTSRLIGGLIMLTIGLLMIFKPEVLMFG